MNVHRLSDAGVRNLGLLFTPPGLPLIVKAIEGVPTTSILVRGGPGTGKTTASLAMAHAIARQNTGAVLFLTTEFSPAEVVAKAGLLGIAEDVVLPWDRRGETQVGSILVQHLSVTEAGEPREQGSLSADQKQRAMEAVWGMLRDPAQPNTAVRAVVIDAFGLPDAEENAGTVRGDLVPFIQALEKRGVSTVLVEEAVADGPDWLAFVTDVVLELSFQSDPDTRELHRKLVCKKCRYAQATPGPHDYGLDLLKQRPSVFVEPLLALYGTQKGTDLPKDRRARVVIPLDEEGSVLQLAGRALLLNAFDTAGGALTSALQAVPGVEAIQWRCGPMSIVTDKATVISFHDSLGPYGAFHTILELAERSKANTVIIHQIGSLGSSRYQTGLPRVLDGLRRHGYIVLVHAAEKELSPFTPLADLHAGVHNRGTQSRIRSLPYCSVGIHLPSIDLLRSVLRVRALNESTGVDESAIMREAFFAAQRSLLADSVDEIASALQGLGLQWSEGQILRWDPIVTAAFFLLSIAQSRLGLKENPLSTYFRGRAVEFEQIEPTIDVLRSLEEFKAATSLHGSFAWACALAGNDPASIYFCTRSFEGSGTVPAPIQDLWSAYQAVYTGSKQSLDVLLGLASNSKIAPLFIDFALRGLVTADRVSEIDAVVTSYLQGNPAPPHVEQRLRTEPLLSSRDTDLLRKGLEGLKSIAEMKDLPVIHKAETLFNIGRTYERLGRSSEARPWYEESAKINPHLTIANEAVARMRMNNPASDTSSAPDSEQEEAEVDS